jgi:multisubunit Na+/H+ antiporter MnhB subunit
MNVLLRSTAVLAVAIALFLIYAVVNALSSDGGARAGVAVGYVVGAVVLTAAAVWAWRTASRRSLARRSAAA